MYVHDAMFGYNSSFEEPAIATSSNGCRVVLPSSTTGPERLRVAHLFDRLFAYIRSVNRYVQACVCAAEELRGMSPEQISHMVLMIQGRRPLSEQQQQRPAPSVFAVDAGQHGVLRGMPELCVLCPRTIAAHERSALIINVRGQGLTEIKIDHAAYDSLYHVLLYPTGDGGWEHNMPKRTLTAAYATLPAWVNINRAAMQGSTSLNPRSCVTMQEYYAYRLHFRRGPYRSDNCMFMSDRLFQEYCCVAYWRIEAARLQYHALRQADMRAARVAELRDFAFQVASGEQPAEIGRISYIPESFVGGPTDMYARYQDAMAAVLHFGAPSLFVTMTANPRWKEVRDSLAFAQTAAQRSDVISRVFRAKLDALLNDLKEMLGKQVVCTHVIEFQKRGLPHAHIVVILRAADRPRTGEQIDKICSAELPPEPPCDDVSDAANKQRRLRELVLEHMLHNDCSGENGRSCPCWDAERQCCSGKFPYAFQSATTVGDERQKCKYRRRRGDAWTATINGRHVTNQWIVPYNAFLLLKYECHLNVEVVTAAYAVKYLFKYLFKGSDSASAALHDVKKILDQIGHYQEHRYLGAAEAVWRLLSFRIHSLTAGQFDLSVERMVVELPEDRCDIAEVACMQLMYVTDACLCWLAGSSGTLMATKPKQD